MRRVLILSGGVAGTPIADQLGRARRRVHAFIAARARRLFTTPRSVLLLNRGSSYVIAGVAVSIARI